MSPLAETLLYLAARRRHHLRLSAQSRLEQRGFHFAEFCRLEDACRLHAAVLIGAGL
jgi:hypothetical protein